MMKNTKVVSLFSVALFALMGCNKTCSKEEFINLANKTESQAYVKAVAKVKGKTTTRTKGIKSTYEPNESFDFVFTKNGEWVYDGDTSTLSSTKSSIVLSCRVLLSMNVKDLVDQGFFDNKDEETKVTYYSSPLGFNAYANYDNYKQGEFDVGIVLNGKSDATYFFDSKSGNVIKYTEKSDITMDMDYADVEISTSTVTDMTVEITYSE